MDRTNTVTAMRILTLCIFILSLLFSTPLWAVDSMRCGNKLITTGDTKAEVLATCGEPAMKEVLRSVTKTKKFRAGEKTESKDKEAAQKHSERSEFSRMTEVTELVEQWTYDPGYGKFLRLVIFRGGRVEAIKEGPRSTDVQDQ